MLTQRIKTRDKQSALALKQEFINAIGQENLDGGFIRIETFDDDETQFALVIAANVPKNTTMSLDISEMNIVPRNDASDGAEEPDNIAPDLPAVDNNEKAETAAMPELERIDTSDIGVSTPVEHVDAELVSERG